MLKFIVAEKYWGCDRMNQIMRYKDYFYLLIWIIAFEMTAVFLGMMTRADLPDWYHHLQRSSLTPPNFVFPLVWTTLYALIAAAGWILWQHRAQIMAGRALFFYGAQQVMNWAWTLIFFSWHWIGFALVWIIILTVLVFLTIQFSWKISRLAAALLMPYGIWLILATYLNLMIYILNK